MICSINIKINKIQNNVNKDSMNMEIKNKLNNNNNNKFKILINLIMKTYTIDNKNNNKRNHPLMMICNLNTLIRMINKLNLILIKIIYINKMSMILNNNLIHLMKCQLNL